MGQGIRRLWARCLAQQRKLRARRDIKEYLVRIPVAALVTLIAGAWAWKLVSPQFTPVPLISSPGTIVVATDGINSLGQKTIMVNITYDASVDQRRTNTTISIHQLLKASQAKSKPPTIIVFLCGPVAEHPKFSNNRFQPITWHRTLPLSNAWASDIGFLSRCIDTKVALTGAGTPYRSNLLEGSSGPSPSRTSGDNVIFAFPGAATIPSFPIRNLKPALLLGDSAFTVALSDPPNDLSNVVASPQFPNSGILQWGGRFSNGPKESQYRLSGNLLNQQTSNQRNLFIAGALVGVAGGAAILFLDLLTKMILTLRTASQPEKENQTEPP
jgi:hypothetical protein